MESFLDEYQKILLVVSVAAFILVVVLGVGGWWLSDSPAFSLLVLGLMGGRAAWCLVRHIRAPRAMLLMDTTLLGAAMFTIRVVPFHGRFRIDHSSIAVTMDRYTQLFPSDVDDLIRRLTDIRARSLAAPPRPNDRARGIDIGGR